MIILSKLGCVGKDMYDDMARTIQQLGDDSIVKLIEICLNELEKRSIKKPRTPEVR